MRSAVGASASSRTSSTPHFSCLTGAACRWHHWRQSWKPFRLMQFYAGRTLNDDPTNYWGPNMACLRAMLSEVQFEVRSTSVLGSREPSSMPWCRQSDGRAITTDGAVRAFALSPAPSARLSVGSRDDGYSPHVRRSARGGPGHAPKHHPSRRKSDRAEQSERDFGEDGCALCESVQNVLNASIECGFTVSAINTPLHAELRVRANARNAQELVGQVLDELRREDGTERALRPVRRCAMASAWPRPPVPSDGNAPTMARGRCRRRDAEPLRWRRSSSISPRPHPTSRMCARSRRNGM